jgi:hypothetical protein
VKDLLVIIPSRGRPKQFAEVCKLIAKTSRADTDVYLCLDDDDPARPEYLATAPLDNPPVWIETGSRLSMAAWTNKAAKLMAEHYRALASIGDDHYPRTDGWDEKLLAALDEHGPGIAYPDDCNPRNYTSGPMVTAPVISSAIVTALGWMAHPGMRHYYIDNVWEDLGRDAGCLYWLPDVKIEHLHPSVTGQAPDATYGDAMAAWDSDQQAFYAWREGQRAIDSATVKRIHDGAV